MAGPFLTPALAGSILAAVVGGVYLGDSSISLIHPVHFKGAAIHPRARGAAIDERVRAPRGQAYSDLYGWEEGNRMRAADCGDCDALGARDAYAYSAAVPYFGRTGETRSDGDPVVEPIRVPAYEAEAEPAHAVVRYASYPVDASEVEEDDAEPAEEVFAEANQE